MANIVEPAPAYPEPGTRRLITISIVTATLMNSLDSTIANVALPHIQGSVSASADEITWVLTSYIVTMAIMIPLCGWLAARFGRKRVMLVSIVSFSLVSILCGLSTNLGELVAFRVLQAMAGAALVPLSQAILLDINPPEQHGPAMAVWGMGAIVGPILGPMVGGWITDNMSWRWCFFINLPVGMLAGFGILSFLNETTRTSRIKLDFFGFAMLSLAIGMLQLMLDRGQQKDWFASTEICIEAALAVFSFYAFLVHSFTATKPFVNLAIFRDVNYTLAVFYGFLASMALFSVLALLPTMMERLLGYPVLLSGQVMAPRGIGSLLAMGVVSRLMRFIEMRLLVIAGFALTAFSMWQLAGVSLVMSPQTIMVSGFLSGVGQGLAMVPLSTMGYATLPATLRNEGAAMNTLIRSIGSAVGISVLQTMNTRSAAAVHARLVEGVRPDNPTFDLRMPGFDFHAPDLVARLNGEISRQASMVSYIDGYWAMAMALIVLTPFILFMRPARRPAEPAPIHLE